MSIFDSMGNKKSVQDLFGIKWFTNYGLLTNNGELLFYQVNPVNISVLSQVAIETKIRQLMHVLSTVPNIEIVCTDSSECFDDNKAYLTERIMYETNPQIRSLLKKDREFLDNIQLEMATARQFAFIMRCRNMKQEQIFGIMNRVEKVISEQGFEVKRMNREDIKRFLALYFDASYNGEQIPDVDGAQFLEVEYEADDCVN